MPVFEKYGFKFAFENHVHLLKESYPLTTKGIDHDKGTLFLGDGAWGVDTAMCKKVSNDTGYLNEL